MKNCLVFDTHSPEQTQQLGERLARYLRPDDCLVLLGGFGVGKTTFVKGLARGMGVKKARAVTSPSFVMLRIYDGRLPLYHFDLYRLKGPADVQNIGWDEFVADGGVTAIEWPQAAQKLLPASSLRIRFSILGDRERRIEVRAAQGRDARFLKTLIGGFSKS